MSDHPDNSHNPVASLVIPYYGRVALSVLPRFLKTIDDLLGGLEIFDLRRLKKMEFNPSRDDIWPDPPQGVATFYLSPGKDRVVVTVKYRPGEEGTRGSVDNIHTVKWISDDDTSRLFYYLEHHCNCKYCNGMQYPFMPESSNQGEFKDMPEEEQLAAIRKYLGEI